MNFAPPSSKQKIPVGIWLISIGIVLALIFLALGKYKPDLMYNDKINCTYTAPEMHCYRYVYKWDGEVACERNNWDYYQNVSYCEGRDCNGLICLQEIRSQRMIR